MCWQSRVWIFLVLELLPLLSNCHLAALPIAEFSNTLASALSLPAYGVHHWYWQNQNKITLHWIFSKWKLQYGGAVKLKLSCQAAIYLWISLHRQLHVDPCKDIRTWLTIYNRFQKLLRAGSDQWNSDQLIGHFSIDYAIGVDPARVRGSGPSWNFASEGPPFGPSQNVWNTVMQHSEHMVSWSHCCHQVRFWALNARKMRLRPGLCPGPRWGSLQRSPQTP